MLILTRRVKESIRIGDEVELTVVSIQGTQVKLGVKAPREIEVHRSEVYDRIEKEHKPEI